MKIFLNEFKQTRLAVGLLGMCVAAIGLLAITGHVMGQDEFYKWKDGVGMAFNTAIAFVLAGAALTLIAWTDKIWRH